MRMAKWLVKCANKQGEPAIYQCISRMVDRRFEFGDAEREHFRMFMRMQENFSGCRVLSYCVMTNHFHVLLEVPLVPEGGISDALLLKRLAVVYSEAFVDGVAQELDSARIESDEAMVTGIHARFTYRMHDLSEFIKTMLQRFTRWFNREHNRRGTLWEERYKSVIVESGVATRTITAYMTSIRYGRGWSPIRRITAGAHAARWLAVGRRGTKKAREGIVRACLSHNGACIEGEIWKEVSRIYWSAMGMALGRKNTTFKFQTSSNGKTTVTKNDAEML